METKRLLLDWIIGVSSADPRFAPDNEAAMKEFGLTDNQIEILKSKDLRSIREWVTYELGMYSAVPVTHLAPPGGTHGLPPPPPPPPSEQSS
jgi:hypothetical protein